MFKCETDIVNYLKNEEKWEKHFPYYKLIGFNEPVFGCISRKRIGLVDIVFTRKGRMNDKYFVEIKFDKLIGGGNFWEALKVIGYAKADNLYHFNDRTKPIIMINKEILNYDYRVILHTLGAGWMCFTITDDKIISFGKSFFEI